MKLAKNFWASKSQLEGIGSSVGTGEFMQVPGFASDSLCAKWTRKITGRQKLWRHYPNSGMSYGNSWYLDIGVGELHYYHAMSAHSNRLMADLPNYSDTMKRAAALLRGPNGKRHLPTRARRENLGPYWCDMGVHILGGKKGKVGPGAVHADFEGLAPYPEMLFNQKTLAFSCILSIATPFQGGGVEVWNARRFYGNELFIEGEFIPGSGESLQYSRGTLTILDSFLYHRILPSRFSMAELWRIVGVIHFLYRSKPFPHWEHWF